MFQGLQAQFGLGQLGTYSRISPQFLAVAAAAVHRPLGAGRKLTFEDLQAQFGLGLKEAAANLGICATTLKRACRRNGITRWPRWVKELGNGSAIV